MNEIVDFKILDRYNVFLKFSDGFESVVDIRPLLAKGFAQELLIEENFRKLNIEAGGGLAWENGFDICPNFLRELAEHKREVA